MILPDVNVLLYAFRSDTERHDEYRAWLEGIVNGPSLFGLSPHVLGSVVRISTHPRIYAHPSRPGDALAFCRTLVGAEMSSLLAPGPRHWENFEGLVKSSKSRGNLVQDAWLAALAIEHGCTWVTTDGDFSRFAGLSWQHPIDDDRPRVNPS